MNKTKDKRTNFSYTTPGYLRETLRLTDALESDEKDWVTIPVNYSKELSELSWSEESLPKHNEELVITRTIVYLLMEIILGHFYSTIFSKLHQEDLNHTFSKVHVFFYNNQNIHLKFLVL